MPDATATVRLPDGRHLGYADHGPPDGLPLLFFHGTPASHPNWRFFGSEDLLAELGLRVLAVDRPGMGRSTFQPGRRIVDWPADVAARLVLGAMGAMTVAAPGLFVRQAASSLPPADAGLMDEPLHRATFLEMMRATLRAGPRGAQHDAALMYGPWELPLGDIAVPVDLWHGEEDRNVPVAVARFYRDAIPTAELVTFVDDGHLSIMTRRGRRILTRLRERVAAS